jgi:ferredoxin
LTDAPLEADPIPEKNICGGCGQCVSVCPLGAGDPSNEEVLDIAGKKMTVCAIDYSKCRTCQNGASGNRYHPAGKPDRLAALCTRTCIDLLDRSGKLGNKFASDFRTEQPWALDAQGNLVKVTAGCVRKPCDGAAEGSAAS